MALTLELKRLQGDIERQVEALSGQVAAECYQCGNCTAGCPTAYEMEIKPNRVVRYLQLGFGEKLLKVNTPWICASCETCYTRCPKGVSVAAVMDALRQIARMRGIKPPNRDLLTFERRFLGTVRMHSRLFEAQLAATYNLTSGHFFNSMTKLPGLLFKGKLKLFPQRGTKKGRQAVKDIYKRALEIESKGN
ncbi:MAG: 4Fe-4S dicluster domain-containing protein [bacterium]|nr:4Fe-4S dicluster domain-containing protein [bacterium]